MKILEIIPQLSSGGAERFSVDLCNELVRTNEVILVVLWPLEKNGFYLKDISPHVKVISLNKKAGFDLRIWYRLYTLISSVSPDIVHTHLRSISYCILNILLNRNISYFHTIHNVANKEAGGHFTSWLRKLLFRHNFVTPITISPASHKSFIEYYGIEAPMIFNGRNIPDRITVSQAVEEEFKIYRKNVNMRVLICLARFAPQKRLPMLARIAKRLENEGYDFSMIFIGNKSDRNILHEIESCDCDNIYILGERTNPLEYLKMADAYCLCSEHEGMPISFIEAIGVGTIPICTPVGGLVNVIDSGNNGFLADDLSETSYYMLLKQFLELPEEKIFMLKNNAKQSYMPFSMTDCASKYYKLFESHN